MKWLNIKGYEINQNAWKKDSKSMFQKVKEIIGNDFKIEASYIKAKDGTAHTEKGDIISR